MQPQNSPYVPKSRNGRDMKLVNEILFGGGKKCPGVASWCGALLTCTKPWICSLELKKIIIKKFEQRISQSKYKIKPSMDTSKCIKRGDSSGVEHLLTKCRVWGTTLYPDFGESLPAL